MEEEKEKKKLDKKKLGAILILAFMFITGILANHLALLKKVVTSGILMSNTYSKNNLAIHSKKG